jgi:site-specific recombinase XerD
MVVGRLRTLLNNLANCSPPQSLHSRPHQLRHLYATEMLRNGVKLEVVGRILGHSSIGITADIHRHVRTGEMHEEARRCAPLSGGQVTDK